GIPRMLAHDARPPGLKALVGSPTEVVPAPARAAVTERLDPVAGLEAQAEVGVFNPDARVREHRLLEGIEVRDPPHPPGSILLSGFAPVRPVRAPRDDGVLYDPFYRAPVTSTEGSNRPERQQTTARNSVG